MISSIAVEDNLLLDQDEDDDVLEEDESLIEEDVPPLVASSSTSGQVHEPLLQGCNGMSGDPNSSYYQPYYYYNQCLGPSPVAGVSSSSAANSSTPTPCGFYNATNYNYYYPASAAAVLDDSNIQQQQQQQHQQYYYCQQPFYQQPCQQQQFSYDNTNFYNNYQPQNDNLLIPVDKYVPDAASAKTPTLQQSTVSRTRAMKKSGSASTLVAKAGRRNVSKMPNKKAKQQSVPSLIHPEPTLLAENSTVNSAAPSALLSSPLSLAGSNNSNNQHRRRIATVEQRKAANVRERKRMMNLNESFNILRSKVPTFVYERKLSRIETLRLAIMYIRFMTEIVVHGKQPSEIQLTTTFLPSSQNNGRKNSAALVAVGNSNTNSNDSTTSSSSTSNSACLLSSPVKLRNTRK